MPTEKNKNGWGIYTIRKTIEYLLLGVTAWQLGVPAFNAKVEDSIKAYEEKTKSTPLRKLLSEETGIREDRIHIVIGQWYKDQKEHDKLVESVWPLLEEEMNSIIPRLVISDEKEFWVADDGEYYRVHRSEDGRGSYYSHGKWNYIFW
jgi:hypothetical protein